MLDAYLLVTDIVGRMLLGQFN